MKITDPKSPFKGWYEVRIPIGGLIYLFGRVMVPDMPSEMLTWLKAHVGGKGRGSWVEGRTEGQHRRILFKDAQKAMLFKLTWASTVS